MNFLIHFLGHNSLTSLFNTFCLLTKQPMIYRLTAINRCICLDERPTFTRKIVSRLHHTVERNSLPFLINNFCLLFKDERFPYTEFLPKSKTILSPDDNSFSAPFISQKNFCCAKMLVAFIMLTTSNNINLLICY